MNGHGRTWPVTHRLQFASPYKRQTLYEPENSMFENKVHKIREGKLHIAGIMCVLNDLCHCGSSERSWAPAMCWPWAERVTGVGIRGWVPCAPQSLTLQTAVTVS